MSHINMSDVNDYIVASKNVIELFKAMAGLLPKGEKHPELEARLADAEKALKASEVQLAKSLGYNLCQCTFPPQIMLRIERHATQDVQVFGCAKCGEQRPSKVELQRRDAADAQMRNQPSSNYF